MKDENKTKVELLKELEILEHRITELQKSNKQWKKSNQELKKNHLHFEQLEEKHTTTLRESINLLDKVVNLNPDWIFIKDRNYQYILANKGFALGIGKLPEDLIGKNDIEIGFPEELIFGNPDKGITGFRSDDKRALKGEIIHNEYNPATTADGTLHIFDTYKIPLRDSNGNIYAVLGYSRDITERKLAEENMKNAKDELQMIMDSVPAMIFYKDTEGRIIRVNKTLTDTFKLPKKDIEGKTPEELFPKEQAENMGKDDKEVVISGKPKRDIIQPYNTLEGTRWSITDMIPYKDKKGKVTGVVSMSKDITEQKKAMEEIEKLAKFPAENPYPVLRISKDGTVLYHNYASESLLKHWHYQEGKPLQDRWHQLVLDTLDHNAIKTVETEVDHKVISLTFAPIVEKDFVNVYGLDVTQRKQAEKALKNAHNQLEDKVVKRTEELQKANLKLQELDQLKTIFIASMSHELRTPLTLIIGFTDIILQEISGEINKEQRRQFTLVKKNASHLLSLISDVLDINKIEAGKAEMIIEEFDLSALSREIKDNFRIATDKKELELSFEIPPTLLIESDRRRTKQILVNLLSNALKFTDRGEIKIKIAIKDKMVEISVLDSGSGIKKEDMNKLFNAFSQIPNQGKIEEGTGLGLYLSKKNAYLLGGDILVESEPGKGSVFTLTLPLKYKEAKV